MSRSKNKKFRWDDEYDDEDFERKRRDHERRKNKKIKKMNKDKNFIYKDDEEANP